MDEAIKYRLIELRRRIASTFDISNWQDLELLVNGDQVIGAHPRLLRSLHFGDDDYDACILDVLVKLVGELPSRLPVIESYVDRINPSDATYVSAKPSERRITFSPSVFAVPDAYVEVDLVAVMMPFKSEFDAVYTAITNACTAARLRCQRVDDLWQESVIVQEIFNLIFRANIVVVDFSERNSNVMYETGIAHTLGRTVVPLAQSLDDVPFDLRHHRTLRYLPNEQGLQALTCELQAKLSQYSVPEPEAEPEEPEWEGFDEVPF